MKKLIVPIVIFVLLIVFVNTKTALEIDLMIYRWLQPIQSETLTAIMTKITDLGSAIFYFMIIIVVLMFHRKNAFALLISTAVGFTSNHIVKGVIQRARPIEKLIVETGYSFPSAHTTCAVLFYGTVAILMYHSDFKYRKLGIIGSILMVLAIAFTRIYLHVHYFTDILGGIVFGVILLTIIHDKVFKNMLNY